MSDNNDYMSQLKYNWTNIYPGKKNATGPNHYPGKIFQIGFNKCATVSLTGLIENAAIKNLHANRAAGYNKSNFQEIVRHYDDGAIASSIFSDVMNGLPPLGRYLHVDKCAAFLDMENVYNTYGGLPVYGYEYFRELYHTYPGSRFILNIRDMDDWIESRKKYHGGSYIGTIMTLTRKSFKQVINDWKRHFQNHIDNVKNFFDKHDSDALLIYDINKHSHELILDHICDILPIIKIPSVRKELYIKKLNQSRDDCIISNKNNYGREGTPLNFMEDRT